MEFRGELGVRACERLATSGQNQSERIEVIDTGIGVAPERLGMIFEAFEQADSTTTRRYGGTGLGLAISRSVCRLMGFELQVQSQVGEGSNFSIVLAPAARDVELYAGRPPR